MPFSEVKNSLGAEAFLKTVSVWMLGIDLSWTVWIISFGRFFIAFISSFDRYNLPKAISIIGWTSSGVDSLAISAKDENPLSRINPSISFWCLLVRCVAI